MCFLCFWIYVYRAAFWCKVNVQLIIINCPAFCSSVSNILQMLTRFCLLFESSARVTHLGQTTGYHRLTIDRNQLISRASVGRRPVYRKPAKQTSYGHLFASAIIGDDITFFGISFRCPRCTTKPQKNGGQPRVSWVLRECANRQQLDTI